MNLWAHLDWEHGNVKKLSYFGDLSDGFVLVMESMANLLIGKNISFLSELSVRECEAFLRDRNSQMSFEDLSPQDESELRKIFQWLRNFPLPKISREYQFSSQKGPFGALKLVDKVRELKAFLNSPEILNLYQRSVSPELVDVDDLTVYVSVPYRTENDRALFDELHTMGVETFREESLNFIPEE